MNRFKIAHIREQGQDMVIIPLDSNFRYKTVKDKNEVYKIFQHQSHLANLRGHVVLIWKNGGSHQFMAPPQWHSFFKTINYNTILGNLNKELSWN